MAAQIGDTVRVLSVPDDAADYGIEEFGVDARDLVGTEAKVVQTTEGLDPFMLMLMGVPEDAVWVEFPGSPNNEFGLGGSEYELVTSAEQAA